MQTPIEEIQLAGQTSNAIDGIHSSKHLIQWQAIEHRRTQDLYHHESLPTG